MSFKRSKLSLASWYFRTKEINCSTGLLSCPIINWIAIIIPSVISPCIVKEAISAVIKAFLICNIRIAPDCWYCDRVNPSDTNWYIWAWILSHSQRFFSSHPHNFISCMPITSCITLLWFDALWAKTFLSNMARLFMNISTHVRYNIVPPINIRNTLQSYIKTMVPKIMTLKIEKTKLNPVSVIKSFIRVWSPILCITSPSIFVSKKRIGSFVNLII